MSKRNGTTKTAPTTTATAPLTLADVTIEWGPPDSTTRLSGEQAAMLLMYAYDRWHHAHGDGIAAALKSMVDLDEITLPLNTVRELISESDDPTTGELYAAEQLQRDGLARLYVADRLARGYDAKDFSAGYRVVVQREPHA